MYLILFLCIPLVIALILIKATEKRSKKRYEGFLMAVRDGWLRNRHGPGREGHDFHCGGI